MTGSRAGKGDIGSESAFTETRPTGYLPEIRDAGRGTDDNPEASETSTAGSSRSALDTFLERNKSFEMRESPRKSVGDNANKRDIPNEHVTVITCMDCRNTDILGSMGLEGATLIRSAGATPSQRDLSREEPGMPMSSFHRMLEDLTDNKVERIIVVPHEGCGMNRTEDDFPAIWQTMRENGLDLDKLFERERLGSIKGNITGSIDKIAEWFGFFPNVNENGSALAKHIQQVTGIPTAALTLDIHSGALKKVLVPGEMDEFVSDVLTQHIDLSDQFEGLDHKPRLKVVVLSDQDGALFEKAAGIQRGDAIHVQTSRLDSLIYAAQPERWNIGPGWYRDEMRSLAAGTNLLGAKEIVVVVGSNSQFYTSPQRAKKLAAFIQDHPAIPPEVSIHIISLDNRTGQIREWGKSA